MQTQQRNVSHRVIRWAYLWEEIKPLKTDSCALFWRCAVLSPLKILALTGGFLLLLFVFAVVPAVRALAPETAWLPAPNPPWTQEDWAELGAVFGVVVSVAICAVLFGWAGFFGWLSRFCVPVEIAGGYVRKGSCPKCANALILDDGLWCCRKCRGYFVPPHTPAAS